jgi:hypothetical protein
VKEVRGLHEVICTIQRRENPRDAKRWARVKPSLVYKLPQHVDGDSNGDRKDS